jgi:hypothetical protein
LIDGKREENLMTASSAADNETDGKDGAFRDYEELDGKMDYVKLFM